jgi:hypothetical protein
MSILNGLPFFGFIQGNEKVLMSVLCESGWYFKFDLHIDHLFALSYLKSKDILTLQAQAFSH